MTRNQTRQTELTELLTQHAELHRSLKGIRKSFAAESEPATIADLLVELAAQLQSHFDHEEEGGYFVEVVEVAPRMTPRVDRLLAQHLEFLETLEQLQEHALQDAASPARWAELNRRFEVFAKKFLEHECDENALLHEIYSEDLGTSD